MSSEVPSHIHIPSDELRQTIDKTVGYILKNGEGFESRLKENNLENKFDFLEPHHEFHGYFNWKIGRDSPAINTIPNGSTTSPKETVSIPEPKPLHFKTTFPRPVSTLDLEVIKLTALFVAKNGDDSLPKLIKHQDSLGNKAQFEFAHKSHSLFSLYEQYLSQYRILLKFLDGEEETEVSQKLDRDIIQDAYARASYNAQHTVKIRHERRQKEDTQKQYASIDWQDFAIVGRIVFDAIDEVQELAIPLNRESLINRSLNSKRKEEELTMAQPEKNVEPEVKSTDPPKSSTPVPKGMKIRAAGESRLKKNKPASSNGSETLIKCPITGKMIPESEFDNHLKVLLRNPRYKEEQENFMRKNFKYESNLTTDQVYENIKRLVRKRQDPEDHMEADKRAKIGPSV